MELESEIELKWVGLIIPVALEASKLPKTYLVEEEYDLSLISYKTYNLIRVKLRSGKEVYINFNNVSSFEQKDSKNKAKTSRKGDSEKVSARAKESGNSAKFVKQPY